MDKAKLIEKLNEAITLELTGLLQYNQYSQVLLGPERRTWEGFFKGAADESLAHARKFSARVVALGAAPAHIPSKIHETTDLHEMLQYSLEHEQRAVDIYNQALEVCADSAAYRNILEEQISMETEDVEELLKYLNQVPKAAHSTHNGHAHTAHHKKTPAKLTA